MVKTVFTICVFLLFSHNVFAANYYVDSTLVGNCAGNYSIVNRTCTGADGNAYTTIQAAVNVATTAGDFVLVRSGSYDERVTTAGAGTPAGGYITIKNYGGETVTMPGTTTGGFQVNHALIKVQGFTFTGGTAASSGYIFINRGASAGTSCYISDNTFTQTSSTNSYGVYVKESAAGVSAANGVSIINNVFDRMDYHHIALFGNDHLVQGNTFIGWNDAVGRNRNDQDVIHPIGNRIIIRDNEVRDFDGTCRDDCSNCATGCSHNHTDFIQAFGECGSPACDEAEGIIVENNFVHDCKGTQIGQVSSDGKWRIRDWTFRNNIFLRVSNRLGFYASGMSVYNTVFAYCEKKADGGNGQYPLQYLDNATGTGLGGHVINNVFLGNADGSTAYGFYYKAAAADYGTPDYNYCSNGVTGSYTACGAAFADANGLNGGDPKFIDERGTSLGSYALRYDSPLRDTGTTMSGFSYDVISVTRPQNGAWDIGAYEYHYDLWNGTAKQVSPGSKPLTSGTKPMRGL